MVEGTFPTIQYHKACKTRFTLERDVDTLKQEQGKRAEEIKQKETLQQQQKGCRRDGICTRSKLPKSPEYRREDEMLPAVCIFCQKSKYINNSREPLTPKSILLPSVTETLTNYTELINLTNKLGHGISYTLLAEMNTENAYAVWENRCQ